MQGLTRWNPFREMTAQKDMDDLFSRFFGRGERLMPVLSFGSYPPVDVVRKGDNLLVNVDLPGIDPKDIDISVTGNVLTIRGKRQHEEEHKEEDYFVKEIGYGVFERSLTLPMDVDPDKIKASYKKGILEILMPIAAQKGKKIEIESEETKKLKAA